MGTCPLGCCEGLVGDANTGHSREDRVKTPARGAGFCSPVLTLGWTSQTAFSWGCREGIFSACPGEVRTLDQWGPQRLPSLEEPCPAVGKKPCLASLGLLQGPSTEINAFCAGTNLAQAASISHHPTAPSGSWIRARLSTQGSSASRHCGGELSHLPWLG